MSGNPHARRYLTSAPLTALYGCAALALLGGSLITPRPGSGPAVTPAAEVIVHAPLAPLIPTAAPTPPTVPTPAVPASPPTPSPAPTPPPPSPTPDPEPSTGSAEPAPAIVDADDDVATEEITLPAPKPTPASRSATRAPLPAAPSRKAIPVDAVPGSAKSYAAEQLDASQYACLLPLWTRESGWNANAVNPASGAYGIPQALPSSQGRPYALGDYRAQIDWGLNYIRARYGSPCGAWSFWQSHSWY